MEMYSDFKKTEYGLARGDFIPPHPTPPTHANRVPKVEGAYD